MKKTNYFQRIYQEQAMKKYGGSAKMIHVDVINGKQDYQTELKVKIQQDVLFVQVKEHVNIIIWLYQDQIYAKNGILKRMKNHQITTVYFLPKRFGGNAERIHVVVTSGVRQ